MSNVRHFTPVWLFPMNKNSIFDAKRSKFNRPMLSSIVSQSRRLNHSNAPGEKVLDEFEKIYRRTRGCQRLRRIRFVLQSSFILETE